MARLFVIFVALLVVHYGVSASVILAKLANPNADAGGCTDARQCTVSDACLVCEPNLGPDCEQPTCINGKCGVIERCSQPRLSPPLPTKPVGSDQCTATDTSRCIRPALCALCLDGRTPACAQATCEKGQCKIIAPCSQSPPTTTPAVAQCKNDGECSFVKLCVKSCADGSGPLCAFSNCIKGKCVVTYPCSQKPQCTVDDTSQCVVPPKCALCIVGRMPFCAQASCVNGQCTVIEPCSLTTSTTTPAPAQCKNDGECSFVKLCVKSCADGSGPLCAFSNCIKGKCVVTYPCSQKPQCTVDDTSQCVVPQICAKCVQGRSPPCAQASCVKGQCETISPCSISTDVSTKATGTTPADACTRSSECPRSQLCRATCDTGTKPLCASAACVNGQCIPIAPCSQRICKTAATCPVSKRPCVRCAAGLGPSCEQAVCSCGVCSLVPPCSKKLDPIVPVDWVMDA